MEAQKKIDFSHIYKDFQPEPKLWLHQTLKFSEILFLSTCFVFQTVRSDRMTPCNHIQYSGFSFLHLKPETFLTDFYQIILSFSNSHKKDLPKHYVWKSIWRKPFFLPHPNKNVSHHKNRFLILTFKLNDVLAPSVTKNQCPYCSIGSSKSLCKTIFSSLIVSPSVC